MVILIILSIIIIVVIVLVIVIIIIIITAPLSRPPWRVPGVRPAKARRLGAELRSGTRLLATT